MLAGCVTPVRSEEGDLRDRKPFGRPAASGSNLHRAHAWLIGRCPACSPGGTVRFSPGDAGYSSHSAEHEKALTEILGSLGIVAIRGAFRKEKMKLLTELLADPRPLTSPYMRFSPETEQTLELFRVIARAKETFGEEAIRNYLISMTRGTSDLLEVVLFAKEVGLFRRTGDRVTSRLHVVPLLETIDDLHRAREIMEAYFRHPAFVPAEREGHRYRSHAGLFRQQGRGMLTANWGLCAPAGCASWPEYGIA